MAEEAFEAIEGDSSTKELIDLDDLKMMSDDESRSDIGECPAWSLAVTPTMCRLKVWTGNFYYSRGLNVTIAS